MRQKTETEKKVRIYYAKDTGEAEKVQLFLKANGIESSREKLGSGAYLDIYAGNSAYGEEIFVAEEEKDRAKVFVEKYLLQSEDREGEAELQKKKDRKQRRNVTILLLLAVILLILMIAATWLPGIFG